MLLHKLKLNWSKLGDANVAYFHATTRGKNKKAGTYKLEDPNGTVLTEHKEIEKEIIRFYSELVGTTAQRTNRWILLLLEKELIFKKCIEIV